LSPLNVGTFEDTELSNLVLHTRGVEKTTSSPTLAPSVAAPSEASQAGGESSAQTTQALVLGGLAGGAVGLLIVSVGLVSTWWWRHRRNSDTAPAVDAAEP